jgi:hypothetical protein
MKSPSPISNLVSEGSEELFHEVTIPLLLLLLLLWQNKIFAEEIFARCSVME